MAAVRCPTLRPRQSGTPTASFSITQRISNDAIYRELRSAPDRLEREGITGLYRIGDCVEPRLIAESIFDGHRLAREIDSEDPATPRTATRENLVLGTAQSPTGSTAPASSSRA